MPAPGRNYASWDLTRRTFPADSLPLACPGLQTVELASYLGADMTFDEETIWYHPASFNSIVAGGILVA